MPLRGVLPRLTTVARVRKPYFFKNPYAFRPDETWDQHKARLEMADRWSTPIGLGVCLIPIAALAVVLWRSRPR